MIKDIVHGPHSVADIQWLLALPLQDGLDGVVHTAGRQHRLLVAVLHRQEVPRAVLQAGRRALPAEHPGLHQHAVAVLGPGEVRRAAVHHQVVDTPAAQAAHLAQQVLPPSSKVVVVQVCPEDVRTDVVPDAVDVPDRRHPEGARLALQHMLPVPVRDLAGLADQRRVHEVAASQLLVQVLHTKQEGAVTKPRLGENGLVTYLGVYP